MMKYLCCGSDVLNVLSGVSVVCGICGMACNAGLILGFVNIVFLL